MHSPPFFLKHPKLVLQEYFLIFQLPCTEFLVFLLKIHSVYECGSQVFIARLVELYPYSCHTVLDILLLSTVSFSKPILSFPNVLPTTILVSQ